MSLALTCPEPRMGINDSSFAWDREIIRQGAFDGGFFRPVKVRVLSLSPTEAQSYTPSRPQSQKSKRELHEDWTDFPSEWYAGLDTSLVRLFPSEPSRHELMKQSNST